MKLAGGIRLGPYELVAPLGAGGMGEVWRANDPRLRREVAVKFLAEALAADADAVARFEREARAAAGLSHPGILAVHDIGVHEGRPYLVTELLRGRSLREVLAGGPLAPTQVARLGAEIARALAAAHRAGIVHRDLKPENLFLTEEGTVKILDFGLATVSSPEGLSAAATFRTVSGAVVGTLGYLAPEQLRGERLGPPADLFGLGCVLHECLTGAPAFRRDSVAETLQALAFGEPPRLDPVVCGSARLSRLVERCLDKDPAHRPAASEVASALEATGIDEETRIAPLGAPLRPRRAGLPLRWAAAAAGAAIAIAVIWVWARGRQGAPPPPEAAVVESPAAVETPPPAPATGTLGDRGTTSEAAWQLYVRARHAWEGRGTGMVEARDLYRQAVDADPTFARAWLGLAETYAILHDYAPIPPGETFPKAKEAARRARELDPTLAGAFTVEAYVASHYDRAYDEAEAAYRRALELAPRDATTLQWYAELLIARGRFDEGFARFREAREADPLAPMALASEVWSRFVARQPEAGIALADRGERDFPNLGPLKAYRALCRLQLGETAAAIVDLQKLETLRASPVNTIWLAYALARAGRRAEAESTLAELVAEHGDEGVISYYRAWVYLELGHRREALAALERSIERREEQASWIFVDPNLAPLRSDPRFTELVRAAGFEPQLPARK
jgi:tetratricopeptide (TPR) repeat protein